MITKQFAIEFAQEWVESWNSHNLERVLSHYHENFVMSSPKIVTIAHEPTGILFGKIRVAEYWTKALALRPDLHFELVNTFTGSDRNGTYLSATR